jgi:4-amino-4-deoxy-L-arabinose transferase-like glycosyltransferase
VGLASLIALRQLHGAANFDEGVYLNSLRALQRGAPLGSHVFASQPPGLYLLLRLDAFLLPDSLAGIRLGFAVLSLAGCLSVFALGRLYSGVLGGISAALLFVAAPPVVELTSRVSPDLAAVSVSLIGIALLAHAWQGRTGRPGLALLATFLGGAALGGATTIKLDAVLAVFAACVFAGVVRPSPRLLLSAIGGLAATWACVLAPFANVAPQLWRSAVVFHMTARNASSSAIAGGTSGLHANAVKIAVAFEARSNIVGWLILVGAAALLVHGLRSPDRRVLWLLVWPLSALAFLLWQAPLFAHHVALLAGAAAIAAGVGFAYAARDTRLRRRLAVAVALIGAFAAYAKWAVQPVQPELPAVRKAVSIVRRASRPGSYILATDQPIVAFLARRRVPPGLVDTSWVRLLTGSITRREILARIRADHVAAVLAGRRLLGSATTRGALGRLYPREIQIDRTTTLYLRSRTHGDR